MKSGRKIYDIQTTANNAINALKKLKENGRPGMVSGTGSKTDVIRYVADDIKLMMEDGWTAQQIADALRNNDVFSILPKTITQIVQADKPLTKKTSTGPQGRKQRRKNDQTTEHKRQELPAKDGFTIVPDEI